MDVVLATMNPGKQEEFAAVLAPLNWRIRDMASLNLTAVEETGQTFVENALLKARAAAQASGLPALADDSGLVVPALNGEPGIYSARYGGGHGDGAANIRRLLARLRDVQDAGPEIAATGQTVPVSRQAYFYCVLVLLRHAQDPTPVIAEGRWDGEILEQPRGDGGFGYDPVFLPAGKQRSAAELGAAEKNRISHRGRAVADLITRWRTQASDNIPRG